MEVQVGKSLLGKSFRKRLKIIKLVLVFVFDWVVDECSSGSGLD
jgi:hypothetical protein